MKNWQKNKGKTNRKLKKKHLKKKNFQKKMNKKVLKKKWMKNLKMMRKKKMIIHNSWLMDKIWICHQKMSHLKKLAKMKMLIQSWKIITENLVLLLMILNNHILNSRIKRINCIKQQRNQKKMMEFKMNNKKYNLKKH
jgi:hypothetical protein